MGQRLLYALGEMEPIATSAPKRSGMMTTKDYLLAGAGFTPAPKYVTESAMEARIRQLLKYSRPAVTSYGRAQRSAEMRDLYRLRQTGDEDGFRDKLYELRDKFSLSGADLVRIRRDSQIPSKFRMFKMLDTNQQRKVLGEMEPEERTEYLPFAKRKLRHELAQ